MKEAAAPRAAAYGPCMRVRMASVLSDSPLLGAAPPSRHKPCDVSPGMKSQAAGAADLSGSDLRVCLRARLDPERPKDRSGMELFLRKCRIQNQLLRECLAECLGVYVLILFGCGSAAQVTTSEERRGQYLSINLGFALGVTFGVFVSRGVSGAHLNPAVSLSLCVLGRHPWVKLPFYVVSQLVGAFLAAATVGLQYYGGLSSVGGGPVLPRVMDSFGASVRFADAIREYGKDQLTVTGPRATAGIFSTYPADHLSLWGGVVDQVIGTAALLLCLLALGDQRNTVIHDSLQPVLVGSLVLVIGVSMGSNCGYALNPARDLGPRMFTYIAGWGVEVFKAGGGWWWVPIVGPCAGALLGTLIYQLMVEVHHPPLSSECQSPCEEASETKMELEAEPYLKSQC